MSLDWTIDALQVGELSEIPAEEILLKDRSRRLLTLPLTMFVVRSGARTIVVDTGGPLDPEHLARYHGSQYACPDRMHPTTALAGIGVDLADVEMVVNTHLHWDHCTNNALFPEAPVYVQRAELEYAVHPLPPHRRTYEIHEDTTPSWIEGLQRIRAVDGYTTIAPGVDLVPLPGHTPGSQGVRVHTKQGVHVITGDCVDTMENWQGDGTIPLPSGSFTSLPDFYRSLTYLRDSGWTPVFSHDLGVVKQKRFGY